MSTHKTRRSAVPEPTPLPWSQSITASTEFQVALGWVLSVLGVAGTLLLGLGIDGRGLSRKMTTALGGLRLRIGGLMGNRAGKSKKGREADSDAHASSDEDDGLIGGRKGRASGVRVSSVGGLRMRRRAEVAATASGTCYLAALDQAVR